MDKLQLSYDRKMYTKNPYNFGTSHYFRDLFGYDDKDWVNPVKQTLEYYDSLLIKKNGNLFLPKGTLLYHGSLNYPFREGSQSMNDPNKITFFGLDATISIWYVLELIEMLAMRDLRNVNIDDFFNRYGYLYLFELTDDLPIHKILKSLSQSPKEQRICVRRNNVCLHPQVNFRGLDRPDLYELSSEVTFYYSDFKDSLQLVDTYLVDPLLLFQNKNDPDYDPRLSVVKIDDYQPEFDQKISQKKYIEYYMQDHKGGKIPTKYTRGLSKRDKNRQLQNIKTAKKAYKNKKYIDRPKLKSYKNKTSTWTEKFKQKYGDITSIKDISRATGIPEEALRAVLKKGRGAYYSSGSRPNQTAESWGRARMYSYIMGGPTRKYDKEITKKYNVKFSQSGGSKPYKVVIKPSTNSEKKKMAIFYDKDGNKLKTTHFGAAGMSDYTKHKDPERKQRYLTRHKKRENWNDFTSAGSLSRYILWGEPTLQKSIDKYKHKFNLK